MSSAVSDLLSILDLEQLDLNLFRGRSPQVGWQRVFGGQVIGQALVAAVRTVEGRQPHSMHAYFLLPGDYKVPIIYDVERIRDGKSFLTRRVVARQHGRPIYYQTLNFQRVEEGFEHQDRMPEVKAPEEGLDLVDLMKERGADDGLSKEWAALDVRWLGNSSHGLPEDLDRPSKTMLWIRIDGRLSDDPMEHLATFTYASDVSLLGAALA